MNAFSLLARKAQKAKSSAEKPVPSAGQPLVYTEHSMNQDLTGIDATASQSSKSKKRKRALPVVANHLPQELDFFARGSTERHNAGLTASTPAKQEAAGLQNGATERSTITLPEDECRRILKQHKLKITRLDAIPLDEQSDSKKKKKRKRTPEQIEEDERREKKRRKAAMDVVPQPLLDFTQLQARYGIDARLAANIQEQGYSKPTEVQLGALPLLMARSEDAAAVAIDAEPRRSRRGPGVDLLTVAPTGSGKTLAFLIPMLSSLLGPDHGDSTEHYTGPRAIIVAPTKELAVQTVHEARKLARATGLQIVLARKRMSLHGNTKELHPKPGHTADDDASSDDSEGGRFKSQQDAPDVIVSTPLTLVKLLTKDDDHLEPLPSVKHLILDEADVLLDALFRKQTLQIWTACASPDLRVSLWSATMGASVEDVARDAIEKHVGRNSATTKRPLLRLVVGLKDSAIPHVSHRLTYCGSESGKLLAVRQLLRPSSTSIKESKNAIPPLRPPFLVFTQTVPRAQALYTELLYDIPASAGGSTRIAVLHADLTSRKRADIMARVRKGEVWVLITTDLLSRGVDFKGINGVVNYDFPSSSAAYVHRVGRTGRAGREGGVAVTLYDKDDLPFLKNVINVIEASQKGKKMVDGSQQSASDEAASGLSKWLLESLPKPTKRDRQRLKKRGIESRRPDKVDVKGRSSRRISTKSGYDKKLENRRTGALESSKRRKTHADTNNDSDGMESDFAGFD